MLYLRSHFEGVFVENARAWPDSVVTPFEGVSRETGETACTSVRFRKLSDAQYTKWERFPKLNVAGSIPVSRSKSLIFFD